MGKKFPKNPKTFLNECCVDDQWIVYKMYVKLHEYMYFQCTPGFQYNQYCYKMTSFSH